MMSSQATSVSSLTLDDLVFRSSYISHILGPLLHKDV